MNFKFWKSNKNTTNVEDIIFSNDICSIKVDHDYKIRIDVNSDDDAKLISEIQDKTRQLNNMPLTKRERKKYIDDTKNIYILTLNKQLNLAEQCAEDIKKDMERDLILRRGIQYTIPAIIAYLLIIIISIIFSKNEIDICKVFIYSCLGGLLSLLTKNTGFEIDYKVDTYIIIIESIKKVILTIVMGYIGYVVIKSNVIFSSQDLFSNTYLIYIIIIICSYSSTFIPNILDTILSNQINTAND